MLANVAARLADLQPVEEEINHAIEPGGEVRDDASPKLHQVRRDLRIARDRLMSQLQSLLHSMRTSLQDAVITQRNGRYVLPVRADERGRVKGIVHDQSASGQTLFIEPLPIVEAGNRIRGLEAEERHEVERILRELSNRVAIHRDELDGSVEALAELDLHLAKGRLGDEMDAVRPILHELPRALAVPADRAPLRGPPPAAARQGRPADRRAWRHVRRAGHHRPEHRRQDGGAQDGRAAGADGPGRAPGAGWPGLRAGRLPARLRRHRRRAEHRAEPLDVLVARHPHRPDAGAGRQHDAGPARRAGRRDRSTGGLGAGPGDPDLPAGPGRLHHRHDPLFGVEGVRARHLAGRERLGRVRHPHPRADLPAAGRRPGSQQRPGDRRPAGHAAGDRRARPARCSAPRRSRPRSCWPRSSASAAPPRRRSATPVARPPRPTSSGAASATRSAGPSRSGPRSCARRAPSPTRCWPSYGGRPTVGCASSRRRAASGGGCARPPRRYASLEAPTRPPPEPLAEPVVEDAPADLGPAEIQVGAEVVVPTDRDAGHHRQPGRERRRRAERPRAARARQGGRACRRPHREPEGSPGVAPGCPVQC